MPRTMRTWMDVHVTSFDSVMRGMSAMSIIAN